MAKTKKREESDEEESDIEINIDQSADSTEIKVDTRAAFLGLAIQTFSDGNDLGRGPHISTCTINTRKMTKHRREKFVEVVGGDPHDYTKPLKNLARFDPEHAIIILIEKRFIIQNSLVENPLDVRSLASLKHVQWNMQEKANWSLSKATVANGNGRIDICRTVLAPKLIREMERIKDLISEEIAESKRADLERLLANVEKELDERACWLVAYYDLDMIERSEHWVKIKIQLASNAPIYQVPDNEDEALNLILDNLCFLPEADRLDNLTSHSTNYLVSCGPKRLMPVVNNTSLIMTIIDLHRYSSHWPGKGFCTNQLYDWRTGVSPFVEAVIKQGIALYDFLASDIEPPSDYNADWELPQLIPCRNFYDEAFFELVTDSYVKHLFPVFCTYGIPDRLPQPGQLLYANKYTEYADTLTADMLLWCKHRSSAHSDLFVRRVLENFPERLRYALTTGIFNKAEYGLELSTLPPLLCKFFVIDVAAFLNRYRYPVMEVFRMLEPLYCSILVEGKSCTEFKDKPTDLLCAWVRRHLPRSSPLTVVNKILSLIFSHRNSALVKIVALDRGIHPKPPPRAALFYLKPGKSLDSSKSSPQVPWSEQYSTLISLMKNWRDNQLNMEDRKHKVLLGYTMHKYKPKDLVTELDAMEHGIRIMEILDSTAMHWAAFSATQITSRLKTIAGYILNTLWMHLHHGLRYLAEDEVWNLREELLICLKTELLAFSFFWDGVDEQPGEKRAEANPHTLALQQIASAMEGRAQQAMQNIAHQILRVTGIRTEQRGLVFAHEVYESTQKLFEEIAVAVWKKQQACIDSTFDPLHIISRRKKIDIITDLCHLPTPFVKATDLEILNHHHNISQNGSESVRLSGLGSLREQEKFVRNLRKSRKTHPSSQWFAPTMLMLEHQELKPMLDLEDIEDCLVEGIVPGISTVPHSSVLKRKRSSSTKEREDTGNAFNSHDRRTQQLSQGPAQEHYTLSSPSDLLIRVASRAVFSTRVESEELTGIGATHVSSDSEYGMEFDDATLLEAALFFEASLSRD